ncbi:MAG: hypothetical protein ACFFG0_47985, partial [Candidatus Thorarchaeota archaeon]
KKMNHIISDGRRQILSSPDAQAEINRIKKDTKEKYASKIADAGLLYKIILKIKMSKEIKQEIEKIAPEYALYFKGKKGDS